MAIQSYKDLSSIVCQLPPNTLFYVLGRYIIDELIQSPINSPLGIKLSLDKPLNNDVALNIFRPAVLRQYYGLEIGNCNNKFRRYTYGSGSGMTSVGMDPHNFVTRALSHEMITMINDLHEMLCNHRKDFNLDKCDLSKKFNHCTVLLYYAGKGLKDNTSLGFHTDCVYSVNNGEYISKSNSQVPNTPAVIYSIGDTRNLKWQLRKIGISQSGRKVWEKATCSKMMFALRNDTLTIIHPDDENPRSEKNIFDNRQYLHGGVNVRAEKFSIGFVFRVVNRTAEYHGVDDTMVFDNEVSDTVNGVLGIDLASFHRRLINLYRTRLF